MAISEGFLSRIPLSLVPLWWHHLSYLSQCKLLCVPVKAKVMGRKGLEPVCSLWPAGGLLAAGSSSVLCAIKKTLSLESWMVCLDSSVLALRPLCPALGVWDFLSCRLQTKGRTRTQPCRTGFSGLMPAVLGSSLKEAVVTNPF